MKEYTYEKMRKLYKGFCAHGYKLNERMVYT
jgi:hypothetical protein